MSTLVPVWLALQLVFPPRLVSLNPDRQLNPTIPNLKYWAVIHVGDQLAVARIANEPDFAKAQIAAHNLGYEAVSDGGFTYFVPVPAWSGNRSQAVLALLDLARKRGFGLPISPSDLSQDQRDHLESFLKQYAGEAVHGQLGGMIRNSTLGSMTISCQVDVQLTSPLGKKNLSLNANDLGAWLGVTPTRPTNLEKRDRIPTYPKRKELFGLGTRSFCLTLSQSTSSDKFLTLLDRAKGLFEQQCKDGEKKLEEAVRSIAQDLLGGDEAEAGLTPEPKAFDSLPAGVRIGLANLMKREPEMFGFANGTSPEGFLSSCQFSFPPNGSHVVLSFLVGASGRASDGSAVNYAVAWDIQDVLGRGR